MAGNDPPHVKEAVYVGVVGARFEKKGCMEYQDILLEGMFITSVLKYRTLTTITRSWILTIHKAKGK